MKYITPPAQNQNTNHLSEQELIDLIVTTEFNQFDLVQNEGGRASCQNNRETFFIMRKSQFLSWDRACLMSYYGDLVRAEEVGRNLLAEKYARMEENTCPDHYEKIRHLLPPLSESRKRRQEEIIELLVSLKVDFAKEYPMLNQNGRSIHSYEDTLYSTSFETYSRGEIGTYSNETFELYFELLMRKKEAGINVVKEIMEYTVHMYGYADLAACERRMEERRQ